AAGLRRHRCLPVPGRRGLWHRGLVVAAGTLRPLWCRRLAVAAGGLSRLREPGLLAVAVRVALRGLVLSHQAAPFVTVSSSTLAVRTDVQAGRTPHPGAMSVVDGNVGTSRMGAAGLLGIRAHPTTTRAGAQHAPSTTPQTLTRRQEIDTFVLWRSTATRSTRRSTPA